MLRSDSVHRPLKDTAPEAEEFLFGLYRQMTPQQKAEKIVILWQTARTLAEAEIRLRRPELSEREIQLVAASRNMPRELMIGAFGWDPLRHGY